MRDAKLLDDAAVREFIANGFLRLTPDVDPGVHREVDRLLRFACEQETWYGNNILARVPRMYEVLDCPVVRGALVSLAGPDYYVHPHRAVHTSAPQPDRSLALDPETDAPPMGKGSMAGSGWHQDAQSPLSRARHHVPRYLIGFYFPHATPIAMGPTWFQAGSHLFAHPVAPGGVVLEEVRAGTFLLRGYPLRWNERAVVMEDAAYALAACGVAAAPALVALLDHDNPWIRINAVFALGEIGVPARESVPAVVRLLDDPHQQVVRQALDALGAIGHGLNAALPKIERLLRVSNPAWQESQVMRGWVAADQVRLNAAFVLLNAVSNGVDTDVGAIERIAVSALGEGNGYVSAVPAETLVRIGTATATTRAIRFLSQRRWDETLMGRRRPL